MSGVLAIWNDCASGAEAGYEHWYQTEHLFERLGVDGFRVGRRFESVGDGPNYLTVYEVNSPSVLHSAAYLERLDNPTPATRAMMTTAFERMTRAICHRRVFRGRMRGAVAVTARFPSVSAVDQLSDVLDQLWNEDRLARIEIWRANTDESVSKEEQLRGGDERIAACICVEALRIEAAEAVSASLKRTFPDAETGVYRLLCQLDKQDI